MPLPPKSNHMITLAEGSVLTSNYRRHSPIGSLKGGMFWKEAVERVISQPGCVAMRYYYARQESGAPALVLVGVDAQGRDMVHGILAEMSFPCPPFCDEVNILNNSAENVSRLRNPEKPVPAEPQTKEMEKEFVRSEHMMTNSSYR